MRSGAARQRAAAANVQDAHEAIRPTDVTRTPESLRDQLDPAPVPPLRPDLAPLRGQPDGGGALPQHPGLARRRRLPVPGQRLGAPVRRLPEGVEARRGEGQGRDEHVLPALESGEQLPCVEFRREQHFTQPPPRYTEASLIKELEERGIGRPSTYAPTIEVIQERNYVRQEERRLHPTELGKTVDGVLREHFPAIVDVGLHRRDGEAARRHRGGDARSTSPPSASGTTRSRRRSSKAEANMERVRVPARDTGEVCPQCGEGTLVVREGKFGEFTGCSRYPECDYIKDRKAAAEPTGEMCPQCGKPLVLRQGRRGPFVGCSGYPTCRYIKGDAPAPAADGQPGGTPPRSWAPVRTAASRWPGAAAGAAASSAAPATPPASTSSRAPTRPAGRGRARAEPTGETVPECGKPLVKRQGRYGPFVSCSGYPGCKYRPPKGAAAEKVGAT